MFRVTEMMTVTVPLTDKYLSTFRRNHIHPRSGSNISGESTIFERSVTIYQFTRSKIPEFFIIIIFLHGLGRFIFSGIDALPSFPGASTISSSSRFVAEGVIRKCGVVHSFEMVDPVLFVFIWLSRLVFQRSLVLFL